MVAIPGKSKMDDHSALLLLHDTGNHLFTDKNIIWKIISTFYLERYKLEGFLRDWESFPLIQFQFQCFQGMIVNGLVPSSISSIERRFKLSTSSMGRIVQVSDCSSCSGKNEFKLNEPEDRIFVDVSF